MAMTVEDAVALFHRERYAIWLEAPDEIKVLERGESPRGIGSRGQYLTPIMFAEGTARSLADETLWVIALLCDRPGIDVPTIHQVIEEMVGRKAGFFELFGLEHAAERVRLFVEVAKTVDDPSELKALTEAVIGYVNRLHVWIDAAFPWGVCSGYMRAGYGRRGPDGLERPQR